MPSISEKPGMLSDEKAAEIRASFSSQGLMATLGAGIVDLTLGRCSIALPFSPGLGQQIGFFHGGAIGAIADSAGGYAAMSTTPAGIEVLTLEYKINFLRPALGTLLVAHGTVLRAGRQVIVTRVDVEIERDGTRQLCAALQQSIMPMAQRSA